MDIIFEQVKATGIIKLNRPKALNALNFDMTEKFNYQLSEWGENDSIKQVLLIGEGKNFCAGGDVKSLSLAGKTSILKKKFFLSEYNLNYKICLVCPKLHSQKAHLNLKKIKIIKKRKLIDAICTKEKFFKQWI